VAALVDFVEVDEVGATKVLQGFIRDVDVEWADVDGGLDGASRDDLP
jgi:hypothetical protein